MIGLVLGVLCVNCLRESSEISIAFEYVDSKEVIYNG